MATIHVLGSLNMDLVCRTARLPQPGETLLGQRFETIPGGKGGNQAVAAARLGIRTAMIGCVGDDGFGHSLLQSLARVGVETEGVRVVPGQATGVATILVDDGGQNQIVVVPGANDQVGEGALATLANALQPGDWLLLQLEVPLNTVVGAATLAQQRGARVILDPAPARADLPVSLYPCLQVITPNQIEASQLTNITVKNRATALLAAEALRQRGVETAMVKLGADGVVVATPVGHFHQSALPVTAVDTVAAGDAFNGGLAMALAEGMALKPAVTFATAVAAYVVTQVGAQTAMPTRRQLETWLETTV
ncbi:MAG: ribokinase [Nodosilinea sp.]|jgi:ribokinase